MTRVPFAVPVTVLVALGGAGSARAADPAPGTWSPPTTLTRHLSAFDDVSAVQGTAGSWLTLQVHDGTSVLRPISAAGAVGASRRADGVVALGAYGNRVAYLRRLGHGRHAVSIGGIDGRRPGTAHVVARGRRAEGLVAGPGGELVVPTATGPVDLCSSAGDGADPHVGLAWSTPRRRSRWRSLALPGRAQLLDLAVDRRGDATLLLRRDTARGAWVAARVLDLRTGRLGDERRLDRLGDDCAGGAVAVDGRGDAVLAWDRQDGGEEANTPYVVRAAFRRRSATSFTPAATLESGGPRNRPGRAVDAAMDAAGRATVVWTAPVGAKALALGATVPRAATSTGRTTLGPPVDLLPSGLTGSVAALGTTTFVSLEGSATPVAPHSDEQPPVTVRGVVARDGAAPFGPVEPVGQDPSAMGFAPSVVAGPAGLRAFWTTDRADGSPSGLFTASRGAR